MLKYLVVIILMGSVKNLKVIREPTESEMGVGRFNFSDRYSVFDWGEMPDLIPNKGAALCMVAAFAFEEAARQGIPHHYRGLVDASGKLVSSDDLEKPSALMEVNLVRVVRPEFKEGRYDYSSLKGENGNYLVPLEVIYRNTLPSGSSVFKRLKAGTLHFGDLELDHEPKPGEVLPRPFIEVTTKLESTDRHLSWEEASEISGLTPKERRDLSNQTLAVSRLITEIVSRYNCGNDDGKVEYAFNPQRGLILVDVFGTADECRRTLRGTQVSKEIARQHYLQTRWYKDVVAAKIEAQRRGISDWKSLCASKPDPLPLKIKDIISQMYMSDANAFTGRRIFDSPPLEQVIDRYVTWKVRHQPS